jgi:excisionase family DNA binding protein
MRELQHAQNRRPNFDELEDMLSPEKARAFLGLSRSTIYERLRDGSIPHRRYGRLIRIPKSALDPAGK